VPAAEKKDEPKVDQADPKPPSLQDKLLQGSGLPPVGAPPVAVKP